MADVAAEPGGIVGVPAVPVQVEQRATALLEAADDLGQARDLHRQVLCHALFIFLAVKGVVDVAVSAKGTLPPYPRDALREVNDELKPRFGNPIFVQWTMDTAHRLASIYQYPFVSIDGIRTVL